MKQNNFPTSAIVNTTNRCSLRCLYCFTNPNPVTMSLQTAKDTMDYLYNNWKEKGNEDQQLGFTWFGGEPTIAWDDVIIPATEYWNKNIRPNVKNTTITITTNGQHLTEERIKLWKEIGNGFLLSIDGCKIVQDHDRPRVDGKSSFDVIEKIAPYLLKYFPGVTFRSTVTPFSAPYLFESFLTAARLGFKNYFVCPNNREHWSDEDKKILTENFQKIVDLMYIMLRSDYPNTIIFSSLFNEFENVIEIDNFKPMTINRCGLGMTSCGIGPKGEIFGCQEHNTYDINDPFYLGDIYQGIIPERQNALLAAYSNLSSPICFENPSACETCKIKNRCSSLFCPSACYATTKTFNQLVEIECFWKILLFSEMERFIEKIKKDNDTDLLQKIMEIGGK